MVVEGLTNRIVSAGGVAVNYSASGNALNPAATANRNATNFVYDRLNRLVATSNNGVQTAGYGYLPGSNDRILYSSGPNRNYLIVYGPDGNPLAGYLIRSGAPPTSFSPGLYLDGKPVTWNPDRLGSQGNPLPYGDSQTYIGEYATYPLDGSGSGMWFAKQRYYNSSWGRFATADPYRGSGGPNDPGSWNRYAYVEGDPINLRDSHGLFAELVYDPSDPGFGDPFEGLWAGLGGLSGTCVGDTLGLFPIGDPFCYAPGQPAAKQKKKDPECFAQLKDRPVDDWRARRIGATHSFWWVQDSTGSQFIVSAGPQEYAPSTKKYLEAWIVPGSVNGQDNKGQTTRWDSGLSAINCAKVAHLLGAAAGFPRETVLYDPISGPNSNSAARYFGYSGVFDVSPGGGAIGWLSKIPGVE